MDYSTEDYKKILTSFIQKQMLILGPNIALDKARSVTGIKVGDDGSILSMEGDGQMLLKSLFDQYVSLSGEVAKMVINSILQKYPGISV